MDGSVAPWASTIHFLSPIRFSAISWSVLWEYDPRTVSIEEDELVLDDEIRWKFVAIDRSTGLYL